MGRRPTIFIDHPVTGARVTMAELAEEYGLEAVDVYRRLRAGDVGERLVRPREKRRPKVDSIVPWDLDEHAQAFVEDHPSGATLDEVADALGITRQAVAMLERSALRKLASIPGLRMLVEDAGDDAEERAA